MSKMPVLFVSHGAPTLPLEQSAARVARQLLSKGFRRVRPLEGGLEAWVAAGLEVTMYDAQPDEIGALNEPVM